MMLAYEFVFHFLSRTCCDDLPEFRRLWWAMLTFEMGSLTSEFVASSLPCIINDCGWYIYILLLHSHNRRGWRVCEWAGFLLYGDSCIGSMGSRAKSQERNTAERGHVCQTPKLTPTRTLTPRPTPPHSELGRRPSIGTVRFDDMYVSMMMMLTMVCVCVCVCVAACHKWCMLRWTSCFDHDVDDQRCRDLILTQWIDGWMDGYGSRMDEIKNRVSTDGWQGANCCHGLVCAVTLWFLCCARSYAYAYV